MFRKIGNQSKNRQCYIFTLIELLIVISIIAILASILLPALRKAREVAYSSSCLNNLKQQALAMSMYIEDSDGYYPPFFQGSSPVDWSWNYGLYEGKYLPDNKTYFCPSAANLTYQYSRPDSGDTCIDIPGGSNRFRYHWIHYGYSYVWVGSNHWDSGTISTTAMTLPTLKMSKARHTSSKVLFCDTINLSDLTRGYYLINLRWKSQNSIIHGRHMSKGANFAWLDGHASTVVNVESQPVFNATGEDKFWNPYK